MSITAFAEPGFAYKDEVLIEFSPLWSQIQDDDTVISVAPGAVVGELRFAWLSSSTDSNPTFKVSENNNFMLDTAKVLREATQTYPDTKWRVVTMQHNPYSASLSDDAFSEERFSFHRSMIYTI